MHASTSPRPRRRARPLARIASRAFSRFAVAALGAFALASASAAPVTVPNGDFSDSGNFGSVGGGLIGASGTDVPIGAGPWLGSYSGVLGLLAPPTLTISSGSAHVAGLAGANLLGILDNGGHFSQTLATDYQPGLRYTIGVDVDAGASIGLSVLASGNFGVALRAGDGSVLASSATAPPQLISLDPLSGTQYHLALAYDAPDDASGAIDVELFAEPQGLIGANLLGAVTFSNVTLDASLIDPSSSNIVAASGTPQTTTVDTAFAESLEVRVTDMLGDPVQGVDVTFAAPASGASADLSATTATTDVDGLAAVDASANTIAGTYTVTAEVDGVGTPASFHLTNTAGAPATAVASGGSEQSTPVDTMFPLPLVVVVDDAFGNPVPDVTASFAAPASGPSATLSANDAMTDANGMASIEATANGEVGSYVVTASVAGVPTDAEFDLTNRVDEGTTIGGTSGDDQSADIDSAFDCALVVNVKDANGDPQAGYAVDFAAPDTGPSAMLTDGVVTSTMLRVLTDANGDAAVSAIANGEGGSYTVTADLVAATTPTVEFAMSNLGGLVFRDGFDKPCAPPFAATP